MTAFDLFQRATCELAEGNRAAAAASIAQAIRQINADGVDAHMREDLEDLRHTLAG